MSTLQGFPNLNFSNFILINTQVVSIDDSQFGFVPGRGTTDAIFVVRQLQEKYLAANKRLYMAFIDLETVLLKTEKDLSHRKGPKRIFGHRKGLIFAIFIQKKPICSRTSDIIMILIST